MGKRRTSPWLWLPLVSVGIVVAVRVALWVMSEPGHTLRAHQVLATRIMGVTYMLCDLTISSSLIMLLLTRDRRAPAWAERRLPGRGRWMWHLLLCLTILSYISLAPTFLYFLIQMRK